MTPYLLQIITPQGIAYENEVVHASFPGDDGSFGVLAHHAPFVTSTAVGKVAVQEKSGGEKTFSVGQGLFEVAKNKAVLFAQSFSG